MYDKIKDTENLLIAARAKKMAIEAEKLTRDNICKGLIYFDGLYAVTDEQERRLNGECLNFIQNADHQKKYGLTFGQSFTCVMAILLSKVENIS